MALINCKECGKEMSENAQVCPNCGNPNNLTEEQKKQEVKQKEKQQQENQIYGIMLTIFIVIIIIAVFYGLSSLWKGLDGDGLLDAMGINATDNSLTIKNKDEEKIDNWKNDAMNWLGFEHVEN